jgi:ATP-dependent DNA helicase RecQ
MPPDVASGVAAGSGAGLHADAAPDVATDGLARRAQVLLETLAGPAPRLHPEQLAAIDAVARGRRRALVVQRTGFGKSAIYFIATRLLREAGAGPTLVISPLLALMRDQVAAARRMGVRSATINFTNPEEWPAVAKQIAAGELDLLLISPERLNNPVFVERVLPDLVAGVGLLVVDEAHCISDWGHDFRPDYRRVRDALSRLGPGTPVLATTATANRRVCDDVADQLGDGVVVLRGALERASLHLGVSHQPDSAHRLAWLAQRIPAVPGTGVVYCLTVAQTADIASFLRGQGIDAHAYSSDVEPDERQRLEAAFKANDLKVLVATSALGMGVDKPDVSFVFHYGAPPSPVAYYQQVGRAGRAVPRAEVWLLPSPEDRRIWDWFGAVGLPPEPLVDRVLDVLGDGPKLIADLEAEVDLPRGRLSMLLKVLDVDGAVRRVEGGGWVRTGRPWHYDSARVERVRRAREAEADAMEAYGRSDECLMAILRHQLDDPAAERCGRCTNCTGAADPVTVDPSVVRAAVRHLKASEIVLAPRKQWPRGLDWVRGAIRPADRADPGRALARIGDPAWWPVVEAAFAQVEAALAQDDAAAVLRGDVGDDLLEGLAGLLDRWSWPEPPGWVTWVPSRRRDPLLVALAERLAGLLGGVPVHRALRRVGGGYQAQFENSAHRVANVWPYLRVDVVGAGSGGVPRSLLSRPVLLLDDVAETRWTVTVAAALLRGAGVPAVHPLVLGTR